MKDVYLHINSRDEFLRINIAKIVYFEADGNYTHIVLANQLRGVVGMNLGQMWQFLVRSDGEHFAYQLSVSKNALKRLKDAYVSFSESDKASKTRFEN